MLRSLTDHESIEEGEAEPEGEDVVELMEVDHDWRSLYRSLIAEY